MCCIKLFVQKKNLFETEKKYFRFKQTMKIKKITYFVPQQIWKKKLFQHIEQLISLIYF